MKWTKDFFWPSEDRGILEYVDFSGDDGKTIYNYMRNPFFKKTAASVRERNVRRKEDYKKVKTTWGQLKGRVEAVKEDGKKDVVAESLLETALRRAQRFEKVVERDRYKGLDISPAWMAAIDAKLISEESMERLSHLVSGYFVYNKKRVVD